MIRRVALFVSCLVDQFYPQVGFDTVRVLERAGLEVIVPPDQTCCGQPAWNSGYHDEARGVLEAAGRCLASADVDAVVVPSGSCAAMMRVSSAELTDSPPAVFQRTYELSELLVHQMGIEDIGARFEAKVVYHDSCHLLRGLGESVAPRRLLGAVKGLELLEMPEAECCGFGGAFSIKMPAIANAMRSDRIDAIVASGANAVVSADMGCLMHLSGGLSDKGGRGADSASRGGPGQIMKSFTDRVEEALTNSGLQRALTSGTRLARQNRAEAFEWMQGEGLETEQMREAAHRTKMEILGDLDRWLDRLEESVVANGGVVQRAGTAAEACDYILRLADDNDVRSVVKSKSMVTEEIDLNERFERAGIEVLETDLGEYIIQLAQERPSHIVAPAIHKSRSDVADLYHELFGTDRDMTAAELTAWTRRRLRPRFLDADMGVSGANFAIADTGTLVIVENEGNARLTTSVPRIHVAVTGIEKVIRSWTDLQTLLPLLPTSATGQRITSYVSFLNGPRRPGETEGPEQFHLILLDNGRREIHSDPVFREALACIRCGACLNACPVYSRIGGHAYGWVYQGPIGAVITPHLKGIEAAGELPFASSLCGACMDACPVKIDIPSLLIHQRDRINREDRPHAPFERWAFRLWSWFAARPRMYRRGARLGRWLVTRKIPATRTGKKSFLEQWNSSGNSKQQRAH